MAERKLPEEWQNKEVPSINSSFAEKMIVDTREYKLITPLFGGGVEPNTPDPVTVIRASEIRGHLRFWWRATRGGQFSTIEELKKAEDAIWGAAAKFDKEGKPFGISKVSIKLVDFSKGREVKPYRIGINKKRKLQAFLNREDIPEYTLFPLKPTQDDINKYGVDTPIASIFEGVSFTILLTYPSDVSDDIKAALWAWETFGGIGARTRRGFGALNLIKLNNKVVDKSYTRNGETLKAWVQCHLNKFIDKENWPTDVPHLSKNTKLFTLYHSSQNAYSAWKKLIDKLKSFRQYRIDKETKAPNKNGHSDWPEPNAIRKAFGLSNRGPHATRNIQKFPRAQFGLPIVFHMPHDTDLSTTLEGETKSRLASPLILKPIAIEKGAIGIGVVLEGTSLSIPLQLKNQSPPTAFQPDSTLTPSEANEIKLLKGETNVLKAFLDYLEQE